MSDFIVEDDYKPKITDARLQQIIQNESAILEAVEGTAIAVITDHLAERYDTAAIFQTTGEDRPKNVIRWATDLILYYLYERINDKMVPERVVFNYKNTLNDLQEIEQGKKSAVLPRKIVDGVNQTKFRWGSQPARSH